MADIPKPKSDDSLRDLLRGHWQNVYLFCASEGFATVVRGWVNKEECGKMLKLDGKKKVVLTQTVGYPKQ